jgi:hypothetical protein
MTIQGVLGGRALLGQLPSGASSGGNLGPGSWSPVTLTNGDGTAITLGQVCYVSANDTARKAQCDGTEDEATGVVICVATSIAAAGTGLFVWGGIVAGLSGGVAGDLGYLSATLGAISAVPILTAGQYNVLLGMWQSATKFSFSPQLPILN